MKKALCILLTFAVIFTFAACSRNKGEPYVEPPTEILSFEDGETMVYEVVTDAAGEAVTDENGKNEVIPYDPPVTEKGGYLVTDPEGSTIKQSATTLAPDADETAIVENEDVDLDDETQNANAATTKPSVSGSTTKPGSTTAKNETTISNPSAGSELIPNRPEATTKKDGSDVIIVPDLPEDQTDEFGTAISKADAQKLYDILDFENTFDMALCDADYYKAEAELTRYISSIESAISQIKADKTLYQHVGNKNLNLWISYMNEAKEKYAVFMGIYRGVEGYDEYPNSFYSTYNDFQDSYRDSLKVYYAMRTGAEAIMYS